MAKKAKGPSLSSYFYQLFTDHPDWLDLDKNDPIFELWRQERGQDMDKKTRQVMANVKSRLRKKARGGAPGRRKGRKPGPKPGPRPAAALAATPRGAVAELERLELLIDSCLSRARGLEVANIEEVVRHLRLARNEIVLMFGKRG